MLPTVVYCFIILTTNILLSFSVRDFLIKHGGYSKTDLLSRSHPAWTRMGRGFRLALLPRKYQVARTANWDFQKARSGLITRGTVLVWLSTFPDSTSRIYAMGTSQSGLPSSCGKRDIPTTPAEMERIKIGLVAPLESASHRHAWQRSNLE